MRRDSERMRSAASESERGEDDKVARDHGSPEVGVFGPSKEAR
jgi:hypothetical protein